MKTSYKLAVVFMIIALLMIFIYYIIGSYVDSEGILREPFFLIPLFWLFILFSLISGIFGLVSKDKR